MERPLEMKAGLIVASSMQGPPSSHPNCVCNPPLAVYLTTEDLQPDQAPTQLRAGSLPLKAGDACEGVSLFCTDRDFLVSVL